MKNDIRFAFFGTSHIAVMVLEALAAESLVPALIVTLPQKKQGRGLTEVATDVAAWADAHAIPLAHDWTDFEKNPPAGGWDVAIVVDYGKILPKHILDIPKNGFLNMHPSLLPRLRGPSPMRSAILNDERDTGVSIMRVDEEMDHGPVVAQKKVIVPEWPPRNSELENLLVPEGGALLARILPEYVAGELHAHEQNHDVATYSTKFTKSDGLLDLSDDPYKNLLKIRAFEKWPGTHAFFTRAGKSIRVNVLDADIINGKLYIHTVKPEGKNEMPYEKFLRSGAQPA
ncbi:methionyl-tRNA formyltransferase [Candidatus Kaiserbacteria bacterium]|nr:methionyl-tRNA formyltransferase [Candidatus Kaiserbacteria bacterium]